MAITCWGREEVGGPKPSQTNVWIWTSEPRAKDFNAGGPQTQLVRDSWPGWHGSTMVNYISLVFLSDRNDEDEIDR